MLPTPFLDFIPQIYRDSNNQVDVQALATFMDALIDSIQQEIIDFCNTYDVARMPSNILDEVGYYLSADLQELDTDRVKREKVVRAVQGHRRRGSWTLDAKPKIDTIIGGNAQLVKVDLATSNDFIITGSGDLATEPDNLWSVVGGDSAASAYGMPIIGAGNEKFLAGVIRIDIDNDTATSEQLENIRLTLADVVAVYFIVLYGAVVGGEFFPYPENDFDQFQTSDGQLLTDSNNVQFISEVM